MFVNNLKSCKKFIAKDSSALRELLNARKGKFAFRYSLAYAVVKSKKATKPHKLKSSELFISLRAACNILRIPVNPIWFFCALLILPGACKMKRQSEMVYPHDFIEPA